MKQLIQLNNELRKQFNEIEIRIQNYFEQIFKKMDQESKILENMTHQLQNQEYLAFKSQIYIIKQFCSEGNENYKQQQLLELNKIPNKLKNMVPEQTEVEQQIGSGGRISQLNFGEAERLLNQGIALRKLHKYQEAIECFDQAISINPQQNKVWNNKAFALFNLNKHQEAIECFDQAISIDTKI